MAFLQNGDQAAFARDAFRPAKFGELSKDNQGQTKAMGIEEHKPLSSIMKTDIELLP